MSLIYKDEYILKKSKNKTVLHIGATDYPYHIVKYNKKELLHPKITTISKEIIGIDNNPESINYLKSKGISDIYYGDIINNKYSKEVLVKKYDLILFPDVIEHLENPGLALRNIKQFMNKKTTLLLTTPNVWSYKYILNHFRKTEFNHPDHCVWFSEGTLKKLLSDCGYKVINVNYGKWGSSKDYPNWYGKVFQKLILNNYSWMSPVIIMELKLK